MTLVEEVVIWMLEGGEVVVEVRLRYLVLIRCGME